MIFAHTNIFELKTKHNLYLYLSLNLCITFTSFYVYGLCLCNQSREEVKLYFNLSGCICSKTAKLTISAEESRISQKQTFTSFCVCLLTLLNSGCPLRRSRPYEASVFIGGRSGYLPVGDEENVHDVVIFHPCNEYLCTNNH